MNADGELSMSQTEVIIFQAGTLPGNIHFNNGRVTS